MKRPLLWVEILVSEQHSLVHACKSRQAAHFVAFNHEDCGQPRSRFLSAGAGTVWGRGSSLHPGIEFGRSRTGGGSWGGRKRGVV